jgi:hypothetical protein
VLDPEAKMKVLFSVLETQWDFLKWILNSRVQKSLCWFHFLPFGMRIHITDDCHILLLLWWKHLTSSLASQYRAVEDVCLRILPRVPHMQNLHDRN